MKQPAPLATTTPATPAGPRRVFTRICGHCGKSFEAESDRARWCSAACKQSAYRQRRERKGADVTTHAQ